LLKQPGDPDLLYYLSHAHASLARLAFDTLAGRAPDAPRTHQLLGEGRTESGNRDAAEKEFRAALAARPDLRGVHLALGELYFGSGDYESAEREFRQEAQLVPGSAAAAYKLGLVLLNRGDVPGAIAELERSRTLRPDMAETLLDLGRARAAAGESGAAEKLFRRVLELESTSRLAESAHYRLADVYRQSGRAAEAAKEMKLFQELRKNRP